MRALALSLALLLPLAARAGETQTVPSGTFLLDTSYLNSSLSSRWNNERQAVPLIDDVKRYEPGGGLQGVLTGRPAVQYQMLINQLYYGITDRWMLALGIPVVLKTTVRANLGWSPGDYQPQLGRAYSEDDFWAWAQSMGQPRPASVWQGNQGTLADMIVGTRYRLPQNAVLSTLGLEAAGTLLVALPTGHNADPEELLAAGTNTWELHSYGDLETHVALDRPVWTEGAVNRLSFGLDGYYAWFRPRTYTAPKGTNYPLLLNQQPYVGDTYTLDPGDWVAGTLIAEVVPFIGPSRASFVSRGSAERAEQFPPLLALNLSYSYVHCDQTVWHSASPNWDYAREQIWRPGDKNILRATAVVSLLRLGLPLQVYASYRDQSLIPGKNTRAANTFSVGLRLLAKFWGFDS